MGSDRDPGQCVRTAVRVRAAAPFRTFRHLGGWHANQWGSTVGQIANLHAPVRQGDLLTVQVLRAAAALLVVGYHAANQFGEHLVPAVEIIWPNGSAGVDIFFVISGLVMVLSAERCGQVAGGWQIFLRQRLTRIVPL